MRIRNYIFAGIVFGALFPALATLIELHEKNLGIDSVLALHGTQHLFWIIDTAPIVLGVLGYLIGKYLILAKTSLNKLNDLSESKFKAIFDQDVTSIVFISLDGKLTDANDAYFKTIGKPRHEVIGKTVSEVVSPEIRASAAQDMKNLLDGRINRVVNEREITLPSGEKKWFSQVATLVRDERGNPLYFIGFRSDITEQKNESTKFQHVFNYCPYPLLVFSENGILDCNPAAVEILGCKDKNDLLSKHPALFSPEFQPDGRRSSEKSQEIDRLAKEKGLLVFEWLHQKIDGTKIPVEVTLSPINMNGKQQLLVHWRDLTEIKRIQSKLIESSKMSSLGEMAGGLAHEINNPLAILIGQASLIKEKIAVNKATPENTISALEKIEATSRRIEKIIKGLKSFSRNADDDSFSRVDIYETIQNTLEFCRERFKNSDIDLRLDVEGVKNVFVECKETQLSQVILNVLNNAFDAVEKLKERWVELSVQKLDGTIQITVTDSGTGIPEPIREKMMMPFFTTKAVGKGTGLGLSISKGIMDVHHGELHYEHHAKNTQFVMRLPLTQPEKLKRAG